MEGKADILYLNNKKMIKLIKANLMLTGGLVATLVVAWVISFKSYMQDHNVTTLYVTGGLSAMYVLIFMGYILSQRKARKKRGE